MKAKKSMFGKSNNGGAKFSNKSTKNYGKSSFGGGGDASFKEKNKKFSDAGVKKGEFYKPFEKETTFKKNKPVDSERAREFDKKDSRFDKNVFQNANGEFERPKRDGGADNKEGFKKRNDVGRYARMDGFKKREGNNPESNEEFKKKRMEGGFDKKDGEFKKRESVSGGFERKEVEFKKRDSFEGGYERKDGFKKRESSEGGFERKDGFKKRESSEGGFERKDGFKKRESSEGGFERKDGFKKRESVSGGFERKDGFKKRESVSGGFERKDGFKKRESSEGGYERKDGFKKRESSEGGYERKDGFKKRESSEGGYERKDENIFKKPVGFVGGFEKKDDGFRRRDRGTEKVEVVYEKKTDSKFERESPFDKKRRGVSFEQKIEKDRFEKKKANEEDHNEDNEEQVNGETKRHFSQFDERSHFQKRPEYDYERIDSYNKKEAEAAVKKTEVRLNKYIANSGQCSRREADEIIASGRVKVNGVEVKEMGFHVPLDGLVTLDGKKIVNEKKMYLLLNKPKDYVTTMSDEKDRKTVMDIVGHACTERVFPVGRLDKATTGLLLFTNDGELSDKLCHPKNGAQKIYKVTLDRKLTEEDGEAILAGLELEDGKAEVVSMAVVSEDRKEVGLEIHIGKNRIVRRIFEKLGYEVEKLDRSAFAGLTKKNLPRGKWRFLSEQEVISLKHFNAKV